MVSLRSLVTGAAALMAAPIMAALTPTQLSDGINQLTNKFQALQTVAQSITIINAPLIVIGQGPFPKLIAGFTDIVSNANALNSQFGGTAPINNPADVDLVYKSFGTSVSVQQALYNILIGKAGLLEKVPIIGPPMAAVLRAVESSIDSLSLALVDLVEPRAEDIRNNADSLGATLELCISKYEGLGV